MDGTKVGTTIPETDYLKGYKFGKKEAQADIDRLSQLHKVNVRARVNKEHRIQKQQSEIDELVDIAERALKAIDNPLIQNDLNNELAKHRKE